jgi:glycerol kinase
MTANGAHVLAIDQGTHATRALLFDEVGQNVAEFRTELVAIEAADGHVEYDAQRLLDSVQTVLRQAVAHAADHALKITAAGLATQRSSVVAWEARERDPVLPLAPLISWQDTRGSDWIEALLRPWETQIKSVSGLPLTAHYGASKLRWLLKNSTAVQSAQQRGTLRLGPLAAFLIDGLIESRPFVVDHANAGRTQLLDYRAQAWDDRLLELFELPTGLLPRLCPNVNGYGLLAGTEIPLNVVQGDQTAALFGLGAIGLAQHGLATVNLGTGAFVCLPQAEPTDHPRLLSGIACTRDHGATEFVLEGTVNGCGAALDWAIGALKAAGHEFPDDPFLAMEQSIRNRPLSDAATDAASRLIFMNGVSGLGSPWWQAEDRRYWSSTAAGGTGSVELGSVSAGEAMAAVAESIVFLVQANLDAMQSAGATIRSLRVSGGVSRSDGICRALASLSGMCVERTSEREATAKGTAWLAAGAPHSWFKNEAIHDQISMFEPAASRPLQRRYDEYVAWLQQHDEG